MRSKRRLIYEQACPQSYEDLSFDEWKDLYDSEPERFEIYRKKLLYDLVNSAPERSKPRLRGLIFQMEAEAIRSKTPIAYSMRLATMMMEMVGELSYQLNRFVTNDSKDGEQNQSPTKTAKILSFNRPSKTEDIRL